MRVVRSVDFAQLSVTDDTMLYGIYLSAQGANVQSIRNDVLANNLANASTTAYKRDVPVFQAHQPFDMRKGLEIKNSAPWKEASGGVSLETIATNHSTAAQEKTGRQFDVAITGRGFMRVRDEEQEFLTRNGRLTRNRVGELVTEDHGLPVISTANTPIVVPDIFSEVSISENGMVTGHREGGVAFLGRIDLVDTDLQQLEKTGRNMYLPNAPVEPIADGQAQLRQGHIEVSGVQPIYEMIQMVDASRAFEANINLIRMQEESLGRLLQSAGA